MPENIKKRSASRIYYGVDKDTGAYRHISEVESGEKCNCKCSLCGESFVARKGTERRHHFAHVSNYDCMYAGEVAVYLGLYNVLQKKKTLCLPAVTLRFPSWNEDEILHNTRTIAIDDVKYTCKEFAYPPLLLVWVNHKRLRLLLDFDHYYDEADKRQVIEDAKAENYSVLMYAVDSIDKGDFSPEALTHMLEIGSRARWLFNKREEEWRNQFLGKAKPPEKNGSGHLCPISASGERLSDSRNCGYCEYNLANARFTECLCSAGIRHKDDFKKNEAERQKEIEAQRLNNEEKQRQNKIKLAMQAKSAQIAATESTEEEMEQEYQRVVKNFDPDAKEKTVDKYKRRWIRCEICGEIKEDRDFAYYGGSDGQNRGTCSVCSRKGSTN